MLVCFIHFPLMYFVELMSNVFFLPMKLFFSLSLSLFLLNIDAHKQNRNEGWVLNARRVLESSFNEVSSFFFPNFRVVEFATLKDMKTAIEKLDDTDLNGRRIRLVEDTRRNGRRGRSRSSSSRSRSHSRRRSR